MTALIPRKNLVTLLCCLILTVTTLGFESAIVTGDFSLIVSIRFST